MFNFLKKLFNPVPELEEVSLEQIETWFKNKTEPIYSKINEQLKEQIKNIPSIIEEAKQDISELENAEVKDEEKIDPKIKQVVLGQRKNYARILNQFVDSVDVPENVDIKTGYEFNSNLNKRLDELGKNTQKPYYTAQHLFSNEVEKVAKDIKELSRVVQQIETIIEKNNVGKIEKSKSNIQRLVKSINKKERLKKDLIETKQRLEKSKKLKQESENKLNQFKTSKEYESFNKLKQENIELINELHNLRYKITDLFSSLIPGLKKFQRVALENEDLIGKYIDNSANALLEDRDLQIRDIIQKMKNSILSNSIDLKNKKREKTLEKIEQITKEMLKEIMFEYDRIKGKEGLLKDKIKANKIIPLIEEAEYKLEHHTSMVEKIIKDIAKLEEDIHNINIENIKKETIDSVKEAINIEVKVISSSL